MSELPPEPQDAAEALVFARAWAEAWSRRDVTAVLSAFAEDVEFTSPLAAEVVGRPTLVGKAALAAYWRDALARVRSIDFAVDDVTFDANARRFVVAYRARINGAERHTTEHLTFGAGGKIVRGAAYHGAAAGPPAAPLTVDAVRARKLTYEGEVEARFIDHNGHMNVAWYVHIFDRATWALFHSVGIDDAYMAAAGRTMFAVEENLRYFAELKQGDRLAVYTELTLVKPKALHFTHAMVDVERNRIAATADLVGVHVDSVERRARPFPDSLLARCSMIRG